MCATIKIMYKKVCRCEVWHGKMDFDRYAIFGGWVWERIIAEEDEND